MVEVTKDEFFRAVGPLDVTPRIVADGSDFELRDRRMVGRIVGTEGHYWDATKRYFLAP